MEKLNMREYTVELETRVDRTLRRWKKESKIENGEAVQIQWQFEQAHIFLDIFYLDNQEYINMELKTPRIQAHYQWSGLTKATMNKVMDRAGNFAQIVQYPVEGFDE